LIGIVATQLFWVRNAMMLKEEQFDHRVSIALKSVVTQLLNNKQEKGGSTMEGCQAGCSFSDGDIKDIIKPVLLDSFIREEFRNLNINLEYEYAIYQKSSFKISMGKCVLYKKEILRSAHATSLSCLWRSDPYLLAVYFPNEKTYLFRQMGIWLGLSALFLLIVIFGFTSTIFSLFRQKKLSQMKTDFVNNMTHEFKTPISTISLSSEMLMKPAVYDSSEKTLKYANIIYDENTRLKNQVEQILQIAALDKGEFQIKKESLDVHRVIINCIDNINILIKQKQGEITSTLAAEQHFIDGDEMHFTNIISNLLDNAIKYSSPSPEILIKTFNKENHLFIIIEDNGIGISREHQKDVFKQFYRVPTGNIHDVKGFGLGLYYVKTMTEAHNGSISLHSEYKKGTSFEISLPVKK
jgi:two-component system phosphate regulon sensor histidine kinase PhoR